MYQIHQLCRPSCVCARAPLIVPHSLGLNCRGRNTDTRFTPSEMVVVPRTTIEPPCPGTGPALACATAKAPQTATAPQTAAGGPQAHRMHLSAVPPPDANRPCWCGDHAMAFTAAVWSLNLSWAEDMDADQISSWLSFPPEASCRSSGDHCASERQRTTMSGGWDKSGWTQAWQQRVVLGRGGE